MNYSLVVYPLIDSHSHTHTHTHAHTLQVEEKTSSLFEEKLDAVVCVAGGWAGGNSASEGW